MDCISSSANNEAYVDIFPGHLLFFTTPYMPLLLYLNNILGFAMWERVWELTVPGCFGNLEESYPATDSWLVARDGFPTLQQKKSPQQCQLLLFSKKQPFGCWVHAAFSAVWYQTLWVMTLVMDWSPTEFLVLYTRASSSAWHAGLW